MLDNKKGQTLLHLARAAIGQELGFKSHDLPRTAWLEEPGATFVTLILNGRLHGCIGSLEASRPLIDDVRYNAVAAAFQDPRYPALTKEEFANIILEIALLSKPERIHFSSEEDALAQLNPGQDGVTLEFAPAGASLADPTGSKTSALATISATDPAPASQAQLHRATFLPHAWADFPHARDLLMYLKTQAGLPGTFWSVDLKLSRFTIQKWREGE